MTGGSIARPRVIARVAAAAAHRVALIGAPAGYGKSVALRQYLETVTEPCVRYDAGLDSGSLLGFVRGFAEAVAPIAPDARATVADAYERSRASATPGADLAMWLHAHVKDFAGRFAVDDLHLAQADPESLKFLAALIERTKTQACWIVASRSTLDLPMGSWLAYGDMDFPINEGDLRFTLDEAREAADASGACIEDEELAEVVRMTEGWPAALGFALRTSTRPADLRNLAATTREMIYRYLAEQVYRSLSGEDREVLHFAAFLPQIELDVLRNAGYAKAKSRVELLCGRVSFIYPDRPGVYRCHDLFRDYLQHEVEMQGAEAVQKLNLRVARALEASGHESDALTFFARAGSPEDSLRLLEACGFDLMEHAHADAVSAAIDALQQEVRRSNPVVLGLRALSEANSGRFDRAQALLQRAMVRSTDAELNAKLTVRLALVLINQGRDVIPLLEPLQNEEGSARAEVTSLLAVAYAQAGMSERASEAVDFAEGLSAEVESDRERAKVLQRIGVACAALGLPLERIVTPLHHAAALAAERGMFSLASRALASLGHAALYYEDDAAKMVWYAQQSADAARKAGDRLALQTALLQLLGVELRRGNSERLKSLEKQIASAATSDVDRMAYLTPSRAALAAWEGRFEDAHRMMDTMSYAAMMDFDRVYHMALHALYLIAARRRESAGLLVASAVAAIERMTPPTLHATRVREMARAICACAEGLSGRSHSATKILQKGPIESSITVNALREAAISLARGSKAPGSRGEVSARLEALELVGLGGVARVLIMAVERCFEPEPTSEQVMLTRAESEITAALDSGRNPKDIARETGRSVYTVQAHVQNIIRKLGCSGRHEALSVARKRGLLS